MMAHFKKSPQLLHCTAENQGDRFTIITQYGQVGTCPFQREHSIILPVQQPLAQPSFYA
jgi:hypothetical protein